MKERKKERKGEKEKVRELVNNKLTLQEILK